VVVSNFGIDTKWPLRLLGSKLMSLILETNVICSPFNVLRRNGHSKKPIGE
jgi:hypothetical protein